MFVGSGKAEEIADLCRSFAADVVIFDEELTPSQQSNLEKAMPRDVKVIDRTALILDIFALHATTKEGRLQVRLAQNEYLLPRLRGMWGAPCEQSHGRRRRVSIRRGRKPARGRPPHGAQAHNVHSSRARTGVSHAPNAAQRSVRIGCFQSRRAGYTNAGKSSLLNRLSGSDVLSYDKLFATLDSTTRKLVLPEGREVTLTDTVGFIQKLPTTLVEAFKSTLDEIRRCDLILHVVDASSDERDAQMRAVEGTLEQIGAQGISRILVFNKIDLVEPSVRAALSARFPSAVLVSAETGEGADSLIEAIARAASASEKVMEVLVPYSRGDVVSIAHERCSVLAESYERGTALTVRVPSDLTALFEGYALSD